MMFQYVATQVLIELQIQLKIKLLNRHQNLFGIIAQ
jgi:hypothetical protein